MGVSIGRDNKSECYESHDTEFKVMRNGEGVCIESTMEIGAFGKPSQDEVAQMDLSEGITKREDNASDKFTRCSVKVKALLDSEGQLSAKNCFKCTTEMSMDQFKEMMDKPDNMK